MAYETVVVDETEHVGTITLDRPDAMNTFSTALARDLDGALGDLDENDEIRAVIVAGAGSAFSAGIDLTEHEAFDSQREYREWVGRMEEPFSTLKNMSTPVIAAAHGHTRRSSLRYRIGGEHFDQPVRI